MEKSIVTTGKTIELAISAALAQLQLDRDNVSVEVLENARSGFLGIGASPAKVKVTYEVPDEPAAPKTALSAASRSKPKQREVVAPQTGVISRPGKKPEVSEEPRRERRPEKREKPANRPENARNEGKPRTEKPARPENKPRPDANRAERAPRPEQPKETVVREYAPAAAGSVEEQIEQFLTGLLRHMGSDAVPHAYRVEEGIYRADLVGGDTGTLIGRRGDTLDAIQYLTGYSINRNREERLRISVDAGDYRAKREEILRQLAKKMAGKAVKYRRNFTLEPMNAYERHVIHAALQDYEGVTTFSTGAEPHRRIVVAYAKEKA